MCSSKHVRHTATKPTRYTSKGGPIWNNLSVTYVTSMTKCVMCSIVDWFTIVIGSLPVPNRSICYRSGAAHLRSHLMVQPHCHDKKKPILRCHAAPSVQRMWVEQGWREAMIANRLNASTNRYRESHMAQCDLLLSGGIFTTAGNRGQWPLVKVEEWTELVSPPSIQQVGYCKRNGSNIDYNIRVSSMSSYRKNRRAITNGSPRLPIDFLRRTERAGYGMRIVVTLKLYSE